METEQQGSGLGVMLVWAFIVGSVIGAFLIGGSAVIVVGGGIVAGCYIAMGIADAAGLLSVTTTDGEEDS